MKNAPSLSRKMALILAIKLVALLAIYWLFFSPSHRVKVDPVRVQSRFFSIGIDRASGE